MKTGKNTLSGNYKICEVIRNAPLQYLRKFKNTQNSTTMATASCLMFDRTSCVQPLQKFV